MPERSSNWSGKKEKVGGRGGGIRLLKELKNERVWRGTDDRQLNNATHSPGSTRRKREKQTNQPTNQTASGRAPVFNCSTATGGLKKRVEERKEKERQREG